MKLYQVNVPIPGVVVVTFDAAVAGTINKSEKARLNQ